MQFEERVTQPAVNILIVEDSATQALRLRYLLEERGYHVCVAGNGNEALTALREHKPTLVLSDIVMPGMDGYQLCREIKDDANLSGIPVILLTSLSDPEDVIKGLDCGADNFIVKPYDPDFLLARVHYILANQELRKHVSAQMGISIFFAGQKHVITAERIQMIDLLLSTYEGAVQKNQELSEAKEALQRAHSELETRVQQRTAELARANEALQAEIAERKSLQAQVGQAEKLAALGELVAGVAHEINNPLGIILGNAELLQRHEDPQVREDAGAIRRMSERATRIVRSLLTFSRSDHEERRHGRLNTAVEAALEMCLYKLRKADIELMLGLQEPAPLVLMNDNQIQQIILNLVNNAEHALRRKEGEKRIVIKTATREINGTVWTTLSVEDNGCGIAEEARGRIFDPFFTTKDVGEGTGLGLSVCHGIAKAHEGSLRVDSAVGVGTTFTLTLPIPLAGAAAH